MRGWGRLVLVAALVGPMWLSRPCLAGDVFEDAVVLEKRIAELHKAGKGKEALAFMRGALEDAERQHGPEHQTVAIRVFLLAIVHQGLGNVVIAEPLYERALQVSEKTFGAKHAFVGTVLDRIADLRWSQKRYAEAEALYRRVLANREAQPKPDDAYTARALVKLAEAHRLQARNEEARPLHERALAIRDKVLAPEHPDVVNSLDRLARVLIALKRDAEAEPLLARYLAMREKTLGPEHIDLAAIFDDLASLYHRRDKVAEALTLRQRALSVREKALGPDHPEVGVSALNLAFESRTMLRMQEAEALMERGLGIALAGRHERLVADALTALAELKVYQERYGEAEPLAKRALALREKTLGADHLDVAEALIGVAICHKELGRFAETVPLLTRALSIRERALGTEHIDVAASLTGLAEAYATRGRFADAEPLQRRALVIREKAFGKDHPKVADSIHGLAETYVNLARYAEAESMMKRALAIRQATHAPDHPDIALSLHNLGSLYNEQGRYAEAESFYKRALELREKAFGRDHPHVSLTLNNLGSVYKGQDRYAEAERAYRRALVISEKVWGPEHPEVAYRLNNLATLYENLLRLTEAEKLGRRALAIFEKSLGLDHPHVGSVLSNLAIVLESQGHIAEAEASYKRALAIKEKALGPDHPALASTIHRLGMFYLEQKRYDDARPLVMRAVAISEKALGPDDPDVGTILTDLGVYYFEQQDWAKAVDYMRRSTNLIIRRKQRGGDMVGESVKSRDGRQSRGEFLLLVKALHRAASKGADSDRADEAFVMTQWALGTEAATSLAQTTARQAKADGALAALVRERQDLVGEWQAKDKRLIAARFDTPNKRDPAAEQALSARLAYIGARLAEIDKSLIRDFPDYATLSNPVPLSIAQVQAELRDDEALVLFMAFFETGPTPEETFVWAITKTQSRYVSIDLGGNAISERLEALRCGLDYRGRWSNDKNAARCAKHLNTKVVPKGPRTLPFDLAQAHDLYKSLFGKIADLTKDKHLMVVPSYVLNSLPFNVLVTQKPAVPTPTDPARYAEAAWLGTQQPITVLPSVSSLKALRQAKASHATGPFIGFGNPLLNGPDGNDLRAWDRQSCAKVVAGSAKPFAVAAVVPDRAISGYFVRGLADIESVRRTHPLPETADELCAVARTLGADEKTVYLGARASERMLKALSADGTLGNSQVVHFATHGLLAGETKRLDNTKVESALMLTPPDQATENEDGLLTASEVAQLKLDADWVIMSACNTASEQQGAEAFSGLARAFFYAGARSLLVSNWYVDSMAAVALTTRAVDALKSDPSIGRSEALRRSMLALMKSGGRFAHPAYWAPFVLVGEGGASGPSSTSPATAGAASPVAASVPEAGSVPAVETPAEQAKTKRRTGRRRKPAGEWDWLGDLWGP